MRRDRVTTPIVLEELTRRALGGDREALDMLVRALQGDVYGLALRMLWNHEDAEDATQEILVRVVTRLSQFGFRSRLKTWVYRLAVNYILDLKKSPIERQHLSFDAFAESLAAGHVAASATNTEQSMLIDEVKVGCSLAMLQCLDRPHRIAFVLGAIMEMSGPEAAEVLEIDPALFRKRLQLAREAVIAFTRSHCGLVSDAASCQCHRRVSSLATAAFDETQPLHFGRRSTSFQEARALVRQVDDARSALALYRTSEPRAATIDFAQRLLSSLGRSFDASSEH
jgi:RNA polymerase sigma factor (sigma-70 family)